MHAIIHTVSSKVFLGHLKARERGYHCISRSEAALRAWRNSPVRETLRHARSRRGWTLGTLAENMGYDIAWVSAWEQARQVPKFHHLADWTAVFGLKVNAVV